MNTLLSPLTAVLLRWTVLLTLGWVAHWMLRRQHARWRLTLWRGLLCAGIAVPLAQFAPLPAFQVRVHTAAPISVEPIDPGSLPRSSIIPASTISQPAVNTPSAPAASVTLPKVANHPLAQPTVIHWQPWLLSIWAIGTVYATYRLIRIQLQLWHLRRSSALATPGLQDQSHAIQRRLHVTQPVTVHVSESISSSFLCGLWKPAILLPKTLLDELGREETTALLAHEIAHVRRHDLFWCVAWQWVRAFFWFHPLVWRIPTAHNLACEQEADRIASLHLEERGSYRQLLARLALRILALPEAETRLALNANSQIAQRLNHLTRAHSAVWSSKHTLAALGLVATLFIASTACRISQAEAADSPVASANPETKTVLVVVQDEEGNPIPGATIKPFGFRVKGIHHADAYNWRGSKNFTPENVTTDQDGKAYVKYPVMGIPEEKEYTGDVTFSVQHPDFCRADIQEYPVDRTNEPIRLTRGIALEVSGYFGADHQSVTNLVPSISEQNAHPEDWQKKENGVMAFNRLSPGGHLVQLMGRLPSGEIVFSEPFFFTAEAGKVSQINLEMKPGIRLEGRIDANVPRPIKNGRVMINVRPEEYPPLTIVGDYYDLDKIYGWRYFWHTYRPIAEDGSFVFESIPPGEVDVTVLGDGFTSKTVGQLYNRVQGAVGTNPVAMMIPQSFRLTAPVTTVEVATEPMATLEVTTTTKSGQPLEGTFVGLFPSAFRMRGMLGWQTNSSEEPYRQMPHLPNLRFEGKTDSNGKLVLQTPAEVRIVSVEHPTYQAPLEDPDGMRDRFIHEKFSPGKTNVLNLIMEPKGTDFIGSQNIRPVDFWTRVDAKQIASATINYSPQSPVYDITGTYRKPGDTNSALVAFHVETTLTEKMLEKLMATPNIGMKER